MRRAMTVICDGPDVAVEIRIEMLTPLPVIDAPGNNMPKMRNDTRTHDELTFRVVIDTPGVAESVCNNFKPVLHRMIAPYASVDVDALPLQDISRKRVVVPVELSFSFGLSHLRRRGKSLQPVQPSVWSPVKTVQRFMAVLYSPSREKHLDVFLVSNIVFV